MTIPAAPRPGRGRLKGNDVRKYSVDAFLEACEASAPLLLDVRREGEVTGRRVALHQPFALVGRASAADLSLKDPRLGKRHAYLQVLAGQVCLVNLLGPEADPWGDRTTPSGWLTGPRAVRLGEHEVRVVGGAGKAAAPEGVDPLAAGGAPRLGMPSLTLEFLRDGAVRLRWHMDRLLALVGSSQECKVRIASRTVSAFHCCLVATHPGIWVVDLLGRDGTHVNNVQVRQALLEDGDVVRLGDISIRVRYAAPPSGEVVGEAAAPVALLPHPADVALPPIPLSALHPASAGNLALAPGLPLGDSASFGAALLPFMNQFAAVQQQMFDQFQQTLLQMCEMFSGLHKDQMGFLRQELEHQRQLARELQELQNELRKSQAPGPHRAPQGLLARPAPANGPTPAAPAAPAEASAAPAAAPPRPSAPPPQGSEAPSTEAANPELNGQDVHAWLYQRMATLQEERQSSWQKIINYLTGKRTESTLP
jgi:hypothetical protein